GGHAVVAVALVADDHGAGAGRERVGRLDAEGALTAAQEGDVTGREAGEVVHLAAARVGGGAEVQVDGRDGGRDLPELRGGVGRRDVARGGVVEGVGRHAAQAGQRRHGPVVGGVEVDDAAAVLERADGHAAEGLAAALRVAG